MNGWFWPEAAIRLVSARMAGIDPKGTLLGEPMPDLKNIKALRRPVVQAMAALACAVAVTVVVLDLVTAALSIFSAPNWSARVLILIGSPALLIGGFTVFYLRIKGWVDDGETGNVSE